MHPSVFLLIFFLSFTLQAQEEDSLGYHRLFLSSNPTTLLNPYKPTPTLGLRYELWPKLHLESSFGYTPLSPWFANEAGERYRGPQIHNHLRYFFRPPQKARYYIGLEHRWQNIRHRYRENYLRQGGAFQEIALADRRLNAHIAMLQFGLWIALDKPQRLWLDLYWGGGIRFAKVETKHPFAIANEASPQETNFEDDLRLDEGRSNSFVLPIGFRLSYGIR